MLPPIKEGQDPNSSIPGFVAQEALPVTRGPWPEGVLPFGVSPLLPVPAGSGAHIQINSSPEWQSPHLRERSTSPFSQVHWEDWGGNTVEGWPCHFNFSCLEDCALDVGIHRTSMCRAWGSSLVENPLCATQATWSCCLRCTTHLRS
jgi:hypothetical protein